MRLDEINSKIMTWWLVDRDTRSTRKTLVSTTLCEGSILSFLGIHSLDHRTVCSAYVIHVTVKHGDVSSTLWECFHGSGTYFNIKEIPKTNLYNNKEVKLINININ